MWTALLSALLAAAVGWLFLLSLRQRATIAALNRSREKIALEEKRVFDFLHGLGTALSEASRPADLHSLIVEGALRVIEAGGGALYIHDRKSEQLRPTFVSRECPPFFEVPESQQQQPGFTWQSYLRLRSVPNSEGLLGEAWTGREPLLLNGSDPRLAPLRGATRGVTSALLGPLVYGSDSLGVLAIARGAGETPFTDSDFQIFKTIVEQSSFAIYNGMIFSQAAEKRRLDQDLQVAHEIQRILLPASAPELD